MKSTSALGRKIWLKFGTEIIISLYGLISLVLVKYYLGFEAVGLIAFGLSFVSTFAFFSDFGLTIAHSKKYNENNLEKSESVFVYSFIKFTLNIFYVIVVTFLYLFLFKNTFQSTRLMDQVVYLSILLFFINQNIGLMKALFAARLERAKIATSRLLGRTIQFSLKVVGLIFIGFSVTNIIHVEIFSSLVILSCLIYFSMNLPFKVTFSTSSFKDYLSFSIPISLITISGILFNYLDKLILQYLLGSVALGIFFIPHRISQIFVLLSNSIGVIFFPKISNMIDKDRDYVLNLIAKATHVSCIFIFPIIILTIIFSQEILVNLFGNDASRATLSFQILLLGSFFDIIASPYSMFLLSSARWRYIYFVSFSTLFLNLFLNCLLITDDIFSFSIFNYGVTGVALAQAFSFLYRLVLLFIISKFIFGFSFDFKFLFQFLIGCLFLIIFLSLKLLLVDSLLQYFIVFIFPLVYFLFLRLLKIMNDEDVRFFLSVINLNKMFLYIKEELRN